MCFFSKFAGEKNAVFGGIGGTLVFLTIFEQQKIFAGGPGGSGGSPGPGLVGRRIRENMSPVFRRHCSVKKLVRLGLWAGFGFYFFREIKTTETRVKHIKIAHYINQVALGTEFLENSRNIFEIWLQLLVGFEFGGAIAGQKSNRNRFEVVGRWK